MPAWRLKVFGVTIPIIKGLRSLLTLTCPRGYNPLGQSLESAWIIFTINNVSLFPESDRWEHFNPKTINFITTIKTNYQYNKSLSISNNTIFRTMFFSNVLIMSIVSPDVVGGWGNSSRASYFFQV